MYKYIFIAFISVFVTGCSTIYSRITYKFERLDSDFNIFYEKGSNDIATEVNKTLAHLIADVEKRQFSVFKSKNEITVYIFNKKERYSNFSMASDKSRGSASKNEIYISPIIRERIETLESILSHELSHIHIRQYVGTWKYINNIPGWFHEGLAVEVSDGGGAENVSESQAYVFFKEGKHFYPRAEGGILSHKSAHDYGLKPHMYYRQSNMFVRYLRGVDRVAFEKCYIALTEGDSFESVWKVYYGKSLPDLWEEFMSEFRT